jgi:hypothetical protein
MAKKVIMLVVAAGMLAALMVPATASAFWTKDHQQLVQNAQIEMTGVSRFHGEIGSIECEVRSVFQLTAGTTTAHVTVSDIDLSEPGSTVTSKCSVSASIMTLGCTDVGSVTSAGLPWVAHAASTQTIITTTGTTQLHLHGGIFCPKTFQVTPGNVHSQMTTANTWSTGLVSGKFTTHLSGIGTQYMELTGHGVVGVGSYGVV